MRVRSSVQSRFSLDMHTMVVSHASLQSSMNVPRKVKAQEVRALATSL